MNTIIVDKKSSTKLSQLKINLLIACLFITSALLFLALPFHNIGFSNDDFGFIFNSKIKSIFDIFKFFTDDVHYYVEASDLVAKKFSFFNAYYRPLQVLTLGIEQFFFGLNAYYYYIFNVFLHSLNACLIYLIFRWILPIHIAFLGTLYFLFHASLASWIWWICTVMDLIHLLFILLLIIFYKTFLTTKKYKFFIYSASMLLLALLTREVSIFIPIAISVYILFFDENNLSIKSIKNLISKTYLFWCALVFYFVSRAIIFGFTTNVDNFKSSKSLKTVLWTISEYLKDILGLKFLDSCTTLHKFAALLLVISVAAFLIFKNKHRNSILYLIFCALTLSWPSIFLAHAPRYIYPAIPAITCAGLLILIQPQTRVFYSRIILILFSAFICFSNIYLITTIKNSIAITSIAEKAIKNFVVENDLQHSADSLLFFGLPYRMFITGIAQGVWLFSKNENIKILHLKESDFVFKISNKFNFEIKSTRILNGIRMISANAENCFWIVDPMLNSGDRIDLPYSKILINEKGKNLAATDISIVFDKKILENKFLKLVTWNFENNQFEVVNNYIKEL